MPNSPITGDRPRAQYDARLTARRAAWQRAVRNDHLLANVRAAVFLIGLATAVWILRSEAIVNGWAVVPVVPFLVAVWLHQRCRATRRRLARAVAHYQRG
ncbi:MAG TPA: hypothetical protein VE890_02220, partial [Thermoguttaceae bacterium]|nr:hypothetical protein [Thermoguttaceae bacterium]